MERAYAILMWKDDGTFLGVNSVVSSMTAAEEMCEYLIKAIDGIHFSWTPTFRED